jgi:pimeloyl-ACP methyl ester carboxylesterase
MSIASFTRWMGRLVPRSLWVGVLFGMIGFISLINPRLTRAATVIEDEPPMPPAPERASKSRKRAAALDALCTPRQRIGRTLGCGAVPPDLPLPEADDIIVFSHGIPVVSWLKRVGIRQWQDWLEHLGAILRARYPQRADLAPGAAWEDWLRRHVRYVEVHFARLAGQRIARMLAALPPGDGQIYLFGHSAGGAAMLQYLADLRDGSVPTPARPIRAILTLNAAVAGPARLWTGWPVAPERPGRMDRFIPKVRHYITLNGPQLRWRRRINWARDYMQLPFRGLGAWALEQCINVLTVSNVADIFSHQHLDDLPFLQVQIGRRFDLKAAATGRTHLAVQRDPRVWHYLWWHDNVPLDDLAW